MSSRRRSTLAAACRLASASRRLASHSLASVLVSIAASSATSFTSCAILSSCDGIRSAYVLARSHRSYAAGTSFDGASFVLGFALNGTWFGALVTRSNSVNPARRTHSWHASSSNVRTLVGNLTGSGIMDSVVAKKRSTVGFGPCGLEDDDPPPTGRLTMRATPSVCVDSKSS